VLISLVALVVAALAYLRSGKDSTVAVGPVSTSTASIAQDAAATAATSTTGAVSSEDSAGGGASGSPPLPTGTATYTVSYQDETATLKPTSGYRNVDLDQPLVGSDDSQNDMRFHSSTGGQPGRLEFASDSIAFGKTPTTTPAECARAIQLSPVDRNVVPSQDLVICVVTNGRGAMGEPDRPKMARIVIRSVGDDGTVVLNVTTWEIPH
jgi:hypothetical protein